MTDKEEIIQNREAMKHQMVLTRHNQNREDGTFENIQQIFQRLPLPRLQKINYKFLFDKIKYNVQGFLSTENKIQVMQQQQRQAIDKIQVKMVRGMHIPDKEDEIVKQTLNSKSALFKSLIYLRKQEQLQTSYIVGELEPFLGDSHYIEIENIKNQIPNLKLFLENEEDLKKHKFNFINENQIKFKNKSFPSSYQIDKRAQVLAKLYLLDLHRVIGKQIKLKDREDEVNLQKKRQIIKIQQQMELQKLKEGELIEEMDLLKQVQKVMALIRKKMNNTAFQQFKNKNGDKSTAIKKSLQKLKDTVQNQQSAKAKLKILITYKHKKGW